MKRPTLSLIAALGTRTRAIGNNGKLLWHIPEDMARFKQLTLGHPIIMGRATFDSIGRPLPLRSNIVLTCNPTWTHEGVMVVHTIDEALDLARSLDEQEIFVIGGGELYAQTIDKADRLYLTLVEDDTPGDAFFPAYEQLPFTKTEATLGTSEDMRYVFVTLEHTSQ
jgi:dihydrofolate reductase